MQVDMSKHFSVGQLIKFSLPSVAMMIFTSIYTIVDGLFVSNFVGKTALAAVNIVFPMIMVLATVGFMMGMGGSALVGRARGEGDEERACRTFSLLIYFSIAAGIVLTIVGFLIIEPFSAAFGATGQMLDDCVVYGRIILAVEMPYILQFAFQAFLITAGKPNLGLAFTLTAGCMNIVLDALLVAVFDMGLVGAAIATDASILVGGVGPLIYFFSNNSSFLRLGKTRVNWRTIGHACTNGSSEMVANIAMSVVTMVYNAQLMALIGENGVAAYSVIAYVAMIFNAMFVGYSMGTAPLMSFQYGASNRAEMRSLFSKGIKVIAVLGVAMLVASQLMASTLSQIFVGYDVELFELTRDAFSHYAIAFLLMGFSIYGSALFTSLSNGLVSAVISFVRTFVFEVGAILLLPMLFGPSAIWYSIVVAELCSVIMTAGFEIRLGRRYGFAGRELSSAAER